MMQEKYLMSEDELEEKVNRVTDLGSELGIFVPIARYSIKSLSSNGEVIEARSGISRSWNRNAYNYIAMEMTQTSLSAGVLASGVLSMRTTANAGYNITHPYISQPGYGGDSDDDDYGIVVGSGTLAESFNSYALSSRLTSGTASGNISYQESSSPTEAYDVGTREYTITWSRYFNNNSGYDISVAEIGLYCDMRYIWNYTTYFVSSMFGRDLLADPIIVSDAGQLEVEYAFSLVYPDTI